MFYKRVRRLSSLLSTRRGPPEQIGVHDPAFPLPGGAAEPLNLLLAFVQLAGYQDFVWGAEVSAPVNLHGVVIDILEGALGVEHDDDVIDSNQWC